MNLKKICLLLLLIISFDFANCQDYLGRGRGYPYQGLYYNAPWRQSSQKIYEAYINQNDDQAPVVSNLLINTTGWSFTWSYISTGKYKLTVSNPEGYDLSISSNNVLIEWLSPITDYNVNLVGYVTISPIGTDANSFTVWSIRYNGTLADELFSSNRGIWIRVTIFPPSP